VLLSFKCRDRIATESSKHEHSVPFYVQTFSSGCLIPYNLLLNLLSKTIQNTICLALVTNSNCKGFVSYVYYYSYIKQRNVELNGSIADAVHIDGAGLPL
jgi:hypothetical protein